MDDSGNAATWLRLRPSKDVRLNWKTCGVQHPTRVDIAIVADLKGRAGITVTHQRIQTREEADGLRVAWGQALSRLKAAMEA